MYLFFIKLLFQYCMWDLSKGLELLEDKAEFVKSNEILTLTSKWNESGLIEMLQEQPVAVLVELKEPLLKTIKAILDSENEANFPLKRTLLGKFNSSGLENVSIHNDAAEIRQTIMSFQPTIKDRKIFPPTIHVLDEIVEKDVLEGSVLLLTMSKPSDEDFVENLTRSLMRKNIQLSVFWAGNYSSDESEQLKKLTKNTGGKFRYVSNENINNENSTENYFPKADFEKLSEQLKFPQSEKEITNEEVPLVSRRANQNVFQKAVVPLIVEVASGTSLEARPGTVTQIQFNVKNNINVAIPVAFNAKFNAIAQNVQPPRALLQPSASITVIVNLQPFGSPQAVNAAGILTLSAIEANKVTQRSAFIFMTPQSSKDNTAPKIQHKYEGDCANYKEPQNCELGHWSLEATLQDEESGLLKILSEPYGLLFQSEFVAGTKSPVTVYHRATCCQPNAIIWAEDLTGNYVKKSFDVFNQNLLAGEIASIVLAVLCIILLIIGVLIAIIIYKRRNQRNLIIPRVRSNSG